MEGVEGRGLWAVHNSGVPLSPHPSQLTEHQRVFLIKSYYLEKREEQEFLARLMGAEVKEDHRSDDVRRRAMRNLHYPD